MTNPELASLFEELANIMEIAGENFFKLKAYRNAAITIRDYNSPIAKLSHEALLEIPGIGKAIVEKIGAAKKAGTFPTLDRWRGSSFASLLPLCMLPGITPKKIRILIKELKINSFDALQDSCSNMDSLNSVKLDDESKRIIYEFARSSAGC